MISWTSLKLNTSTLKKTMSREWKDKPQTRIEYLQSIHVIKDCYWNYMKRDAPIRVAKIQDTDNIKFWQGREATETVVYCWWVWKVLQSLWKTFWQLLTNCQTYSLSCGVAVALLIIYWADIKTFAYINTLPINVCNCFIHNIPKLEATKMSFKSVNR